MEVVIVGIRIKIRKGERRDRNRYEIRKILKDTKMFVSKVG